MSNIYQITHELEINEILENNKDKITTVIFSTNNGQILNVNLNRSIKKTLKQLSEKYTDHIFVYADLEKYFFKEESIYTKTIKGYNIPYTYYFYEMNQIAKIEATNSDDLIKATEELITKILPVKQNMAKVSSLEKLLQVSQELNSREKIEQIEKIKQQKYLEELEKIRLLKENNV
jgi:hypothetical protein